MKPFPLSLPVAVVILAAALLMPSAQPIRAADPGPPTFEETFDAPALVKGWLVQYGEWQPVAGVLRGRELAADKHAAAARRVLPMQDGRFSLRFRFTGPKPEAFHFGFDPAPGQLPKRGHLFSVIVTPQGAKLMKHVDKNKPKEDPNVVLATADATIAPEVWHTLIVEKVGNSVKASLAAESGSVQLSLASTHPTFHVKTPTLVFRCLGDGVEVDDIRVWSLPAQDDKKP